MSDSYLYMYTYGIWYFGTKFLRSTLKQCCLVCKMSEDLLRRLAAVKPFLARMKATSKYAEVSASQKEVVKNMVKEAHLCFEDLPGILTAIAEIDWSTGHADELTEFLAQLDLATPVPRAGGKPPSSSQPILQDFEHVPNYLTGKQWQDMLDDNIEAKELLVAFVNGLGCQHATEGAARRLTSIVLLVTDGVAKLRGMSPQALKPFFQHVKTSLHKACCIAVSLPLCRTAVGLPLIQSSDKITRINVR